MSVDAGVTSDGLTTTVHPAASAGASFMISKVSGLFHGVIAATTPIGSRTVKPAMFGMLLASVSPSGISATPGEEVAVVRERPRLAADLADELAVLPHERAWPADRPAR